VLCLNLLIAAMTKHSLVDTTKAAYVIHIKYTADVSASYTQHTDVLYIRYEQNTFSSDICYKQWVSWGGGGEGAEKRYQHIKMAFKCRHSFSGQ
jgi:hypothetical protein